MKLPLLLLCCLGMVAPASAADTDTVVLLHGLGRTRWSMSPLATALARDGYHVVNLTYPSRTVPLETLARDWLPAQLRAHAADASRVHFVTHSMGGILVRLWLRECGTPANLGRVVMLAPPNAGSELTDRLNAFPPFRWFTGENGRRLGTAATALPATLGPWSVPSSATFGELGVIAADRSLNPLLSALLPGPDDGKVTVARTHLTGETDHIVLPFTHTWLAWRTATARQITAFLSTGRFLPAVGRGL